MIHNMGWTGGPDGIAGIMKPKVFGFSLARSVKIMGTTLPGGLFYYFFVLVFVFAAIVLAKRFHYSWMGLAWNALREDEISSKCYGINITINKLYAFIFGSIFAGVSGVLYAHFVGFVSPENMTFHVGLLFVSMVILGGMDNVFGVVIGAALLVIIPEKFRAFQDFRLLFYGAILILMLLFRPQGLIPFKVRSYRLKGGVDHE
jgi:branched-chain amino acid transport system permease protein